MAINLIFRYDREESELNLTGLINNPFNYDSFDSKVILTSQMWSSLPDHVPRIADL